MTTDLTPESIAHLRELDAARTQGEWEAALCSHGIHGTEHVIVSSQEAGQLADLAASQSPAADAEFIAAAANALPGLLDAAEERDALRGCVEHPNFSAFAVKTAKKLGDKCADLEAEVSRLRAELAEARAVIERATALRARLDVLPHPQEPHVVADIAEAIDAALVPATQREEADS
jgi:hypothetical protein